MYGNLGLWGDLDRWIPEWLTEYQRQCEDTECGKALLQFNFSHIARGIVPELLKTNLTKDGISQTTASKGILQIFRHISKDVHNKIWLPRCRETIAYETEMGITTKQKVGKQKRQGSSQPKVESGETTGRKRKTTKLNIHDKCKTCQQTMEEGKIHVHGGRYGLRMHAINILKDCKSKGFTPDKYGVFKIKYGVSHGALYNGILDIKPKQDGTKETSTTNQDIKTNHQETSKQETSTTNQDTKTSPQETSKQETSDGKEELGYGGRTQEDGWEQVHWDKGGGGWALTHWDKGGGGGTGGEKTIWRI
jgi:hypothetical protein